MRNECQDPTGDVVRHERPLIALAREQAAQARARAAVGWSPLDAGPFSADSPDGFTGDATKPLRDLLPGYELQHEIHRGGQGVVYQALHKSAGRQVAIKVMKEGPFAGADDKARFDREVRILGQLNHPNIVTIHDSGTAAGCFYFVMDYIAGSPLDAYMRNGERTLEETLLLFVKICDGVNAAHLRGIIHRDLKPSNIRIDAETEPHILDFGLAKVEDGSSALGGTIIPAMTRTGQFVGSLPWASPEQVAGVAGGIDVRSDVYSLGVVLYHMLSGTFPYEVHGHMHDVVQRILHAEPIRPSAARAQSSGLRRLFGGKQNYRIADEVETVVLKCLNKQREDRYQTAGELARDVRHYLAGEPIEARRHSLGYLLYKYVQQHRLNFAFACTLLAVLVAGLIVSLTFWRQAEQRETDIRQVADAQAKMLSNVDPQIMGARLREDIFAETRAALQRSGADAEQTSTHLEQLESLLAGTNFTSVGARSIDRNVLTPALASMERDFAEQPLVQATLSASIANAYYRLGLYDEALPPAERALQTRRDLLGDDHPDTLESINRMGDVLGWQGNLVEAEAHTREALETRRRVLGDDHPDTLRSIADMGMFFMGRGEWAEAEAYTREALETRRRVLGDDHPATLESISRMGTVFQRQGKLSEAEPYFSETLENRRRVLGDDSSDTLESLSAMGALLLNQGKLSEAEPYFREALKGRRRVLGDEHPFTLLSISGMGALRQRQGRPVEAERYYREALKGARRVLGDENPRTLGAISNMGGVLKAQGKLAEAEPYYREALEGARRLLGNQNRQTLGMINKMGSLLRAQGRLAEAETYTREALETRRRVLGDDHPDTLESIIAMGAVLSSMGKLSEAEPYFRESLEGRRRILGDEHPSTLNSITGMGGLLRRLGKHSEAEPYWLEVLETRRRVLGDDHRDTALAISNMGLLRRDRGQLSEAEELFAEGLRRARGALLGDSLIGSFLRNHARTLAAMERFEQAEAELVESQEILVAANARTVPTMRAFVELYDAWHAAEPGRGHDAEAAEWRAKLASGELTGTDADE